MKICFSLILPAFLLFTSTAYGVNVKDGLEVRHLRSKARLEKESTIDSIQSADSSLKTLQLATERLQEELNLISGLSASEVHSWLTRAETSIQSSTAKALETTGVLKDLERKARQIAPAGIVPLKSTGFQEARDRAFNSVKQLDRQLEYLESANQNSHHGGNRVHAYETVFEELRRLSEDPALETLKPHLIEKQLTDNYDEVRAAIELQARLINTINPLLKQLTEDFSKYSEVTNRCEKLGNEENWAAFFVCEAQKLSLEQELQDDFEVFEFLLKIENKLGVHDEL